jgi:hypothetical protein
MPAAAQALPFAPLRRDTPPMVHAPSDASTSSPASRQPAGPNRVHTVNMMAPPVAVSPLPFQPPRGLGPPSASAQKSAAVREGSVAHGAARLNLEQYASLAAEVAVWPAALVTVRTRYGLDETAHRHEQELWQTRFSADSALFARYAALFQQYREWLERGAG